MLIKLQKTRFSPEYFIIENAREVVYREKPFILFNEDDLSQHMGNFINQGLLEGTPHYSCWYQKEKDGKEYTLEWNDGYQINHLRFKNAKGEYEEIMFDGEAFLCNDEGKTIHRMRRGGCSAAFRPIAGGQIVRAA